MTIFQLQEARAKLVKQYRDIVDAADNEKRELSAEDNATLEKIDKDIEEIDSKVDAAQAAQEERAERISRLEQLEGEQEQIRNRAARAPVERPEGTRQGESTQAINGMDLLGSALAPGHDRTAQIDAAIDRMLADEEANGRLNDFGRWLGSSNRPAPASLARFNSQHGHEGMRDYAALQMDSDSAGGALIPPEVFIARFIRGLDEAVVMRQISTVLPMAMAHSIGIAAENTDPADSDWTVELSTGTLDTAMNFGKRKLRPRDLAKRILVSDKLLRFSSFAEAYVRERMIFKMAVTQEKAFLTGNGALQPLGVFTASADGISTGQDVSTDNTTSNVTADGLINAKYNLAAQYLMSANLRWIFHRLVVRNIRKLKDGNGQYLWNPGLGGQPNTLLDVPVIMSEFAPSTFTTGLYVGIIGDFSHYYIADTLTPTIRRLDELHYATNQVGFYTRSETDGMPVLEEAFTRVTLA